MYEIFNIEECDELTTTGSLIDEAATGNLKSNWYFDFEEIKIPAKKILNQKFTTKKRKIVFYYFERQNVKNKTK